MKAPCQAHSTDHYYHAVFCTSKPTQPTPTLQQRTACNNRYRNFRLERYTHDLTRRRVLQSLISNLTSSDLHIKAMAVKTDLVYDPLHTHNSTDSRRQSLKNSLGFTTVNLQVSCSGRRIQWIAANGPDVPLHTFQFHQTSSKFSPFRD
ncbi:hypothetical protein BaRGS_00038382 [Batillaria attramentaria]|uniref:Uncharacterized protein n=1 Tax=Batillaria attramentaria TaxID=370345 RepID=A0ABD0J6A0_9CAEN